MSISDSPNLLKKRKKTRDQRKAEKKKTKIRKVLVLVTQVHLILLDKAIVDFLFLEFIFSSFNAKYNKGVC